MLEAFRTHWSIRARVYTMLAVVTILSLGTMAAVSYRLGVSTLEAEATARITAVRELKARQIEQYFQTIRDQLVTLSEDRMVVDALREFSSSASSVADEIGMAPAVRETRERGLRLYYQDEFLPRLQAGTSAAGPLSAYWPQDDVAVALQHLFISENPFDPGSKLLLDASDAGTRYDAGHERFHPLLRSFLERFGYYDVFLVSAEDRRVVGAEI